MALFAFGNYDKWGEYFVVEAANEKEAKEKIRKHNHFTSEVEYEKFGIRRAEHNTTTDEEAYKKALKKVEKKYFSNFTIVEDGVWPAEWA